MKTEKDEGFDKAPLSMEVFWLGLGLGLRIPPDIWQGYCLFEFISIVSGKEEALWGGSSSKF
jgi:hypothetical protein